MQRASATLAFLLLFGALTGVLIVAGLRHVDHPTAAEAFFEKYQQRAPLTYETGRILVENTGPGSRMKIDIAFDTGRRLMYYTTDLNGERADAGRSSTPPQFAGAEVSLKGRVADPFGPFDEEPYSVRFREDSRAKQLGARQLIVEFAPREPNLTPLTQLLMIDEDTYRLIFAESSWGAWDPSEQRWSVLQSRVLSNLNEPVTIPTAMP